MTLILDTGAITAIAGQRARLAELRRRGQWPPLIPAVVLTEALTGDHRRDFHENRLIAMCQVRPVTETHAREAARLRTLTGRARTGRARTVSAVDAIVAVFATTADNPIVLTSDPDDITTLTQHDTHRILVSRA